MTTKLAVAAALAFAPALAGAAPTEMERLQKTIGKYAGKQPCICQTEPSRNVVGYLFADEDPGRRRS